MYSTPHPAVSMTKEFEKQEEYQILSSEVSNPAQTKCSFLHQIAFVKMNDRWLQFFCTVSET